MAIPSLTLVIPSEAEGPETFAIRTNPTPQQSTASTYRRTPVPTVGRGGGYAPALPYPSYPSMAHDPLTATRRDIFLRHQHGP